MIQSLLYTFVVALFSLTNPIFSQEVDPRQAWVGTFAPVSGQCTPSTTCCCSSGQPMVITEDATITNGIDLSGTSDGGLGCFGETTLGGTFTLSSSNTHLASYSVALVGLTVNATLSADDNSLVITTSLTECPVDFVRVTPTSSSSTANAASSVTSTTTNSATSIASQPPTDPVSSSGNSGDSTTYAVLQFAQRVLVVASSYDPGQHSVMVALGVLQATPIIDAVYMHYATTNGASTTSVSLTLQSPSSITFATLTGPIFVYVSPTIIVLDDDALTYSLSFMYNSVTSYTPFTVWIYNDTISSSSSSSTASNLASSPFGGASSQSSSTADIIYPSASSTAATALPSNASPLLGEYQSTSLCTPSSICCCSVGVVSITDGSTSSTVLVTSALDAGSGCFGMASLSGAFSINTSSPLSISNTFTESGVSATFTATLSNNLDQLTISNSFENQCISTAIRLNPTASEQQAFVGQYSFDSSCHASADCCCAVGLLNISAPESLNKSQIELSGTLDGSAACAAQTDLAQVFDITAPLHAEFSSISPSLTLIAQLSPNYQTLNFSNSLYKQCDSIANRVSNLSVTSNQTDAFSFADLTGTYESDGSCVPSLQCCCTTGLTTIVQDGSSLMVTTTLQGVQLSCLGMDGRTSFTFSPTNVSFASSTFDGVTFDASVQPDGSVLISNTLHPDCPTRMIKISSSTDSSNDAQNQKNSQEHVLNTVIITMTVMLLALRPTRVMMI